MLRPSSKIQALGSVVTAVVIFVAVNFTASEWLARYKLDFTSDQLFTLSAGTRNILNGLAEDITLKFFVSKSELLKLPGVSAYAGRIEDFLREYERLSNGKVKVQIIDPEPFSESEDLAVGYGLEGIVSQSGNQIYLGLVGANSIDGIETIPFFFPEREELIEYDLTKMIYQLANSSQRTIGLISSLPVQGTSGLTGTGTTGEVWTFLTQLSSFFNVQILEPTIEKLPQNLDLLMLIHPRNLSDSLLYQIDQFTLQGGGLVTMVDPYSETLASLVGSMPQLADTDMSSNLNLITKNWGIELDDSVIVGDLPVSARVLEGDGSSGNTVNYPVWMNVQPEQLNDKDLVTADLGNIILATAGSLRADQNTTLEITPLIQTSKAAKKFDKNEFVQIENIRELIEHYVEGNESLLLAARISGKAQTAFPEGHQYVDDANIQQQRPHVSEGEVNAIIIADTDFLRDRFWVRTQQIFGQSISFAEASNGELIRNVVENLSGDKNLIGLRARGQFFRPFTLTQKIRLDAEQRNLGHELQLQQELERVENLLTDYSSSQNEVAGERILTNEQQDEIKQIRDRQIIVRKQLRDVKRNLQQDIDRLEFGVTMLNLLTVPLLVSLIGVFACVYGRHYREHRLASKIIEQLR